MKLNPNQGIYKKIYLLRVCLDGGFRRGRERRTYFSFLNYGYYKMSF